MSQQNDTDLLLSNGWTLERILANPAQARDAAQEMRQGNTGPKRGRKLQEKTCVIFLRENPEDESEEPSVFTFTPSKGTRVDALRIAVAALLSSRGMSVDNVVSVLYSEPVDLEKIFGEA